MAADVADFPLQHGGQIRPVRPGGQEDHRPQHVKGAAARQPLGHPYPGRMLHAMPAAKGFQQRLLLRCQPAVPPPPDLPQEQPVLGQHPQRAQPRARQVHRQRQAGQPPVAGGVHHPPYQRAKRRGGRVPQHLVVQVVGRIAHPHPYLIRHGPDARVLGVEGLEPVHHRVGQGDGQKQPQSRQRPQDHQQPAAHPPPGGRTKHKRQHNQRAADQRGLHQKVEHGCCAHRPPPMHGGFYRCLTTVYGLGQRLSRASGEIVRFVTRCVTPLG